MFRQFEDRFAVLDALPDSLYQAVATHSHGQLLPRAKTVLYWRDCLLAGRLPEADASDWPEAFIRRTLLMRLETLELAQYCTGQESLTDSIILDMLEGVSSAEAYFAHKPGGFVDKLAQRQKIKDKDSSFRDEEGLADHVERQGKSASPSVEEAPSHPRGEQPDVVPTRRLGMPDLPAPQAISPQRGDSDAGLPDPLTANWQELAEIWRQLSPVYRELGGLLGRGWDLSQGVLSAQGWRDIVRYRQLLKQLPELEQLIALLGRIKQSAGAEQIRDLCEQVLEPVKRPHSVERSVVSRHAPMETGGIVLSDDLSRLLPSELSLLGHAKLKWLWHARRAERQLLTYCHCGLLPDPRIVEQKSETQGPPQPQASSLSHGPIIVCLDTSASMHGMPENVAKALVLEGLRLAYQEGRPCHVYAFGGPDQMLEHELDLTRGGLRQLLHFLQHSFHGGTDVVKPLLVALEKQRSEVWHNADILLVTDGRFPLQQPAFDQIQRLKCQQGLRLHGVMLGNWHSPALQALCEPLHRLPGLHRTIQ